MTERRDAASDRDLRVVTGSAPADELAQAIREQTDALKRLVDELARERHERKQAKASGAKRARTIRARAKPPREVSAEAHAAAERFVARLGSSR